MVMSYFLSLCTAKTAYATLQHPIWTCRFSSHILYVYHASVSDVALVHIEHKYWVQLSNSKVWVANQHLQSLFGLHLDIIVFYLMTFPPTFTSKNVRREWNYSVLIWELQLLCNWASSFPNIKTTHPCFYKIESGAFIRTASINTLSML